MLIGNPCFSFDGKTWTLVKVRICRTNDLKILNWGDLRQTRTRSESEHCPVQMFFREERGTYVCVRGQGG